MAVSANFGANTLTVFADNADNTVDISRNAAGQILVNGGAIKVIGGTPTVANTVSIQVFGLGGNDNLVVNEANGALPRVNIFAGTGNDTVVGGSGGDFLFGQAGNDSLNGKGGNDFLFGGDANDTLTGGDANDQMFGEAGDDRMIWNPGDDNDLMEGGSGNDRAEINGGNGAETFSANANGTRVRFDRVEPAPFFVDIGTTENLVVNMNGGDDRFSATGNLAVLTKLTVDGGDGNDTILGGNGADTLIGGAGNDFIDGQQGADTALLGSGDDVFQWDAGDGSDVVEGQDGTDMMLFNGSSVDETMEASANGSRLRFTRNVGNIVMDTNDVERIDVNALGGADNIVINDLSGTDVTEIHLALGGADRQADRVTLNATNGDDLVQISAANGQLIVLGLGQRVVIDGFEAGYDTLAINGLAGDDVIEASGVGAGALKLLLDGGAGNDIVLGGDNDDNLLGGDGDDVLIGGLGQDVIDGGLGENLLIQ